MRWTVAPLLLPAMVAVSSADDCHGRACQPIVEFCSVFLEGCDKCANICNVSSHNFQADACRRDCYEFSRLDPLRADIQAIQTQQSITVGLLALLLALITLRHAYKCLRWLQHKRCFASILKKLRSKKAATAAVLAGGNAKDAHSIGGATTIQNVMTIGDVERTTSQVYSVTGAEGSVMTMTTPVSTRYPAENSTTPSTSAPTEYSYDNQALAVTPVSEKPKSVVQVF